MITNSIIDISDFNITKSFFKDIVLQLDDLMCEALQVRSYTGLTLNELEFLMDIVDKTNIEYLEIYTKFTPELTLDKLTQLLLTHTRVSNLFVHTAEEDINHDVFKGISSIYYLKTPLNNESCCGVISKKYFNSGLNHYMESQFFYTCLNKKISIDSKGNIKNCPSMKNSYGTSKNTTLKKVIEQEEFKVLWNIKKDFIDTCKDCEFRHVCTDCRAYIETPDDLFSKPLKCGYDPYTNEWKDWSSNELKEKAIKHYNVSTLVTI